MDPNSKFKEGVIALAVVKIELLNVIGKMEELDEATVALGKTRVFHPDNALSFYSDTTDFSPVSEANPYSKPMGTLAELLDSIGKKSELSSICYPKTAVLPVQDWQKYIDSFSASVHGLLSEKQKCTDEIRNCDTSISRIRHFDGLNLDLDELKKCQFVKIRFGSLPEESYKKLSSYTENPYVAFFPSKFENALYWGMYCAPVDQIEEVDRIFAGLYFERVSLQEYSGTVSSAINDFISKKKNSETEIAHIDSEIQSYWEKERSTFFGVYVWLNEKSTYYDMRHYAARYGDNFIIAGWIPADKENDVKASLDKLKTVKYSFDKASSPEVLRHSPPIKLNNKKLWRPFELFIDVYGLPSYNEIDPTAFVAITYFLFFGLMFADLGQGLCIVLIGLLLWKKKHSALGRVMIPCGIASSIVGTLFGSVFGFEHALDPMYKAVFGLSQKPISVMDNPVGVVNFAIGLGVLMVMLAILTNIFASLKRRQYTSGLFGPNGVTGFIFYTAVIFGLAQQVIFSKSVFTPAYVVCFIVIPLVLMMFRNVLGGLMERKPDWKPESWGEMIMENFFEVFEYVLSYLTNTISFIRIGAYVLVHAGMMLVTFKLAEFCGGGIGYVLVLILGNAFVIALEGLLSGVQSLRLEFYELFSRFYDGSGRPYTPVTVGQKA